MPYENALALCPEDAFQRIDESSDQDFYATPRFVTHIDDVAINFVTNLYREFFLANTTILDLMSSWVSHLPPNVNFKRVVGLGMNQQELTANPRLNQRVVQNLNQNEFLPFGDNEFDAAAICVSVQYLIQPIVVFSELARVLNPNAPLIVTFSNRCFPTKAVLAWRMFDDDAHVELVHDYFVAGNVFKDIEIRRHRPRNGDPLFAVIGRVK